LTRKTKVPKTQPHVVYKRTYSKFNPDDFQQDMSMVPWHIVYDESDVNEALHLFTTLFCNVADQHAPAKRRTVRSNPAGWVDDELREVMKLRDDAKKEALASGLVSDMCIYKKLRNAAVKLNRKKKASYFKSKIAESRNDPKEMWRTLNGMMGRGLRRSACTVERDGEILTKAGDVADYFNSFFTQKVNSLRAGLDSQPNGDLLQLIRDKVMVGKDCSFDFQLTHWEQIHKHLLSLSNGKATGLDNVDNKLLRLAADQIARPLCYIINLSLITSEYPTAWKRAKVVPLPKSSTTRLSGPNSRPISLLPAFSKVMEKVVSSQISDYFRVNDLMSPYQHAYRKHHSTCTALLHLVDDWYRKIDQGNIVGVIFLDFSAAFDLVDHSFLLQKLACYGFSDTAVHWMNSYLAGREQCVHFNGTNSPFREVNCGVPQGSCLGPLLFTIFTNDLPFAVRETIPEMYADDTSAYTCSPSVETVTVNLQEDLNNICNWVRLNRLFLNANKTMCMLIGSRPKMSKKPKLTLFADGCPIQQVTTMKLLGSTLDECLTWDLHVEETIKKMARSLGAIRRSVAYLDQSLVKMLTETLTLQHLDYCAAVWASTTQKNITALQVMQNKAGRLTLGTNRTPIKHMHNVLSWLTVSERLYVSSMCTLHKVLLAREPSLLYSRLHLVSGQHSYHTRHAARQNLRTEKPKTNSLKKSFTYRAASDWNKLSHELQTANTSRIFRRQLVKHMRDLAKDT